MDSIILAKYKKAGEISKKVKRLARDYIKAGMTHLELAEFIDDKIVELGGFPSFPTDISVNDCAAHYAPYHEDQSTLKEGDLVKIDMGASVDGYVTDTAFTVSLSKKKNLTHEKLIEASEAAVDAGIKKVKAGAELGDIGAAIEKEITSRGFKSISNLSGHTVEQYIVHANVSIPNVDTGSTKKLEEGWVIAIEPFPSTGSGRIKEGKSCKVFEIKELKTTRQHRDILKYIWTTYNQLPFCERNIIKKFGVLKTKLALRSMVRQGILHEYSVLQEEPGSLVSQAEHTMIVTKEGCILLT